jgi:hypothetical protein
MTPSTDATNEKRTSGKRHPSIDVFRYLNRTEWFTLLDESMSPTVRSKLDVGAARPGLETHPFIDVFRPDAANSLRVQSPIRRTEFG